MTNQRTIIGCTVGPGCYIIIMIYALILALVIGIAGCNEGFIQPEQPEPHCTTQFDTTFISTAPPGERGNIFHMEIQQVSICPANQQ